MSRTLLTTGNGDWPLKIGSNLRVFAAVKADDIEACAVQSQLLQRQSPADAGSSSRKGACSPMPKVMGRKITPRGWMQGARCRTLPGVHERLGPELRSCAIWRGKRVNRGGRCSHSLAFLCMACYGGAGPLLSATASIAWIYDCQPGVLLGYVVRCYRAMYVDPRPAMSTSTRKSCVRWTGSMVLIRRIMVVQATYRKRLILSVQRYDSPPCSWP